MHLILEDNMERETPWSIPSIAKVISRIKNLPAEIILGICADNTSQLYKVDVPSISIPHPIEESQICFQGHRDALSNMYPYKLWHPCMKITYNSSEQAYQHIRAVELGELQVAKEILHSYNGYEAKRMSHRVPKQKVKNWSFEQSCNTLQMLIELKYKQVPEFQAILNESDNALLLKATRDQIWGIGVTKDVQSSYRLSEFPGQNVFGWLLMAYHARKRGIGIDYLWAWSQANLNVKFFEGIITILNNTYSLN